MRTRAWLSICALATCCSDPVLFVPLPDSGATSAQLVARLNPVRVRAFDSPDSVHLEGPGDDYYLLAYSQSLENLGLVAGPLDLAPGANCALREPAMVWRLHDPSEANKAWSEAEVPQELLSALVPDSERCDPCLDLEITDVSVPRATGDGTVAVPLADDGALIGFDHGDMFVLTSLLNIANVSTFRGLELADGTRDETGRLWLALDCGEIRSGLTASALSTMRTAIYPECQRDLRIATNPSGTVQVLVSRSNDAGSGSLWLIRGQETTKLREWLATDRTKPGAIWYEGAFYVVAHPNGSIVFRVEETGEVLEEALPSRDVNGLTAIAAIDGLGVVAGNQVGESYVRGADGTWSELDPGEHQPGQIRVMLPLAEGFLAGGKAGFLHQYVAGRGFCPPQGGGSGNLNRLINLGDGFLGTVRIEAGEPDNGRFLYISAK